MKNDKPNVDSIVLSALDIPDGMERQEYLDKTCGCNSALRDRAELLLDAHAKVSGFLESPAGEIGATEFFDGDFQDVSRMLEKPGKEIGPYKILQQIGEGGFGVVYMAEQSHPVRRRVALKVIKPGMDTKEVIARFEAERQALALMDHPNIARVYDAGSTESGRPYFVMELVKGVPLVDFCNENRLKPEDRLRLFVTVCRAIQHAHQKGVIHRDLKPSNILVTIHDNKPVPKVIDFGVSKAISQQLTEKTLFTAFGQMVGTPIYMSPEQAQMSGLDVDTRSDVYSLGVVLFELLTGTTPLDAKRLRGSGYAEMQRLIREEEAPKPSMRLSSQSVEVQSKISTDRGVDPKQLGSQLRGDLDWIVMRALEKDRGRRYDSANSFADDLERFLLHKEVEACPPSASYRLRKFIRRHRASLAVASTIAVLLIVGTCVSIYLAVKATQATQLANNESEKVKDALIQVEAEKERAESAREVADRARFESDVAKYASQIRLADPNFAKVDSSEALQTLSETDPKLRGWEYDRLTTEWESRRRWIDSDHEYYCVDLVPNDQMVAGGSRAGIVRLFEIPSGMPRGTLQADGKKVMDLQFTSDGHKLVVATDRCLSVWELETRKEIAHVDIRPLKAEERLLYKKSYEFQSPDNPKGNSAGRPVDWETRLALSRDDQRIAVSTPNGIQVWNLSLKEKLHEFPYEFSGSTVGGLDFSPDHERLIAYVRYPIPPEKIYQKTNRTLLGRKYKIVNLNSEKHTDLPVNDWSWVLPAPIRDTVHVHENGKWFCGAGNGMEIVLRDSESAAKRTSLDMGTLTSGCADLVGNRIAFGGTYGTAFVYDVETRKLLNQVAVPVINKAAFIDAVALNSQGTILIGACNRYRDVMYGKPPSDFGLVIWTMEGKSATTQLPNTVKPRTIPGDDDDVVRRLDTRLSVTKKADWFGEIVNDRLQPAMETSERIDPNREFHGTVKARVRSFETGETILEWPEKKWRKRGYQSPFHRIVGSPGGEFLAYIFGNEVEIWEVKSANLLARLSLDAAGDCQLSRDGRHMMFMKQSQCAVDQAEESELRQPNSPNMVTMEVFVWDVLANKKIYSAKKTCRTDDARYLKFSRPEFHPSGKSFILPIVEYEKSTEPAKFPEVGKKTTFQVISLSDGKLFKTVDVPVESHRMIFGGNKAFFHENYAQDIWSWNLDNDECEVVLSTSRRYHLIDVTPNGSRLIIRQLGRDKGKSSSLILVETETFQTVKEIPRREGWNAGDIIFAANGDLIFVEAAGVEIMHVKKRQ